MNWAAPARCYCGWRRRTYTFPIRPDGRTLTSFEWRPIEYRNVISVLKNPFYAGVYGSHGKSEERTTIIDGRARKRAMATANRWAHGRCSSRIIMKATSAGQSTSVIQTLLAGNAYGRVGDTKSGRGGRALLAGLICCARCSRRLERSLHRSLASRPIYRCEQPNVQLGQRPCLTVAGKRIDETIAVEMLAPRNADGDRRPRRPGRMLRDRGPGPASHRRAGCEKQAQYDASLAERRCALATPTTCLIAAQLEKAWETSLERVGRCRERLDRLRTSGADDDAHPDFTGLADDLSAAWQGAAEDHDENSPSDWCVR